MYNQIPPARISRHTKITLILLVSTLFFAGILFVLVKNIRVQKEQKGISEETLQIVKEDENDEVFEQTFPTFLQTELGAEDDAQTPLSGALHAWLDKNPSKTFCETLGEKYGIITGMSDNMQRKIETFVGLANEEDKNRFSYPLQTINELFSQGTYGLMPGYNVCKGTESYFLLLEKYNLAQDELIPVVVEFGWNVQDVEGWTVYLYESAYRSFDGYRFIPDWQGNRVVITGYGDAGYGHWQTEFLTNPEDGITAMTLEEKCLLAPKEDDMSVSLVTCEKMYEAGGE